MRAADLGTFLASVAGRHSSADIWYARIGDHSDDVAAIATRCLSDEERAKVGAYRSEEAAERYVVTRALVRTVLSEQLNAKPGQLRIGRTDAGKPTIQGLHFNLSHSGDLVLLAVNERQDIGIDVERRREVDRVAALIRRWLTPSERADVEQGTQDGLALSEAFLRVWSEKEARLKALGVGIAGAHTVRAADVECVRLEPCLATVTPSADASGYVGALAFA